MFYAAVFIRSESADYYNLLVPFKTAEDFEATEGTLQLWNIYEVNGYFDQSIIKFEEAYTIDSNIDNLSKLIWVLLNKWDLDRAYSMIQTGLNSKYDMDLYLYSYHFSFYIKHLS